MQLVRSARGRERAPLNFRIDFRTAVPEDFARVPHRLSVLIRGLIRDVVGRVDGENALVAADEECPFEEPAALVVQKILVPVIFDKLWNHNNNMSIWMFL